MESSTEITAYLGKPMPMSFNTITDVLPHATQLTRIDVRITDFQFTHQSFLNFLQTPMPNLSWIALGVVPGGLPHSNLIFEFSPQRFPALTALSLTGIGLKCTSLGNLRTLDLHDFPKQPATITFNGLLDLLDSGSYLTQLTLDNYLTMAFNDQPSRRAPVTMRALKELYIRDIPQQIVRLLHHLRQLPRCTTIGGLYGTTPFERQPSNFNAFLAMLPPARLDLYYAMCTDIATAKLELSDDTIGLACKGRQGDLVLEVHSTLRTRRETRPESYNAAYSAVVASAGAILGIARALATLECTGTQIAVEHGALVNVFLGCVSLRHLTIVDPYLGHTARGVLAALVSDGTQRALCPYLECLTVRQATYAPELMDAVMRLLRSRERQGRRLKRLELMLQAQVVPKGKDRYGQPTYEFVGARSWEKELLTLVDSVQITDL
ncbi:hypothetical protein L226DRAFT_203737 [Lentinus tigrinus ALCF2SS1-7]|uniref:RNI-like protein n=1 Tax=Lentinus tigrinus ALCF2SS1-6 TaxID=1328759 RepID=A0A5C2SRY2_9APHY|nr:hypothetical protein L227DRAFT_150205 [Lentinus tigrinus ALCF2SS1-6]RPD80562.1 hypothetical protein L226DRAFT_203737 [Lentinus tigrinus ALCF2SS1-7]